MLIGHSQGSYILTRLIRDEIEGHPVQNQMISAFLLGSTVTVAAGEDTGGSFQNIPLCRAGGPNQLRDHVRILPIHDASTPEHVVRSNVGTDPDRGVHESSGTGRGETVETHAYLSSGGATIAGPRQTNPWVSSGAAIETPFVLCSRTFKC